MSAINKNNRLITLSNNKYGLLFFIGLFGCLTGCKKFVEVQAPTTNPVSSTVYSSIATASSAIAGLYESMMQSSDFIGSAGSAKNSYTTYGGLSADEFVNFSHSAPLPQVYSNSLTSSSGLGLWQALYKIIYLSNSILQGVTSSSAIPGSIKEQMIGEAQFTRAFCYFYLVNLFGNVPLVLTTNYESNSVLTNSPVAAVYEQIISDLNAAQSLLPSYFVTPIGTTTTERTLPNKYAANALLARVYLYTQKWDSAEIQADTVINSTSNFSLVNNLNQVFLANSAEAIWQLEPVQTGWNTPDGGTYILEGVPPFYNLNPVTLSLNQLDAFEAGDYRRVDWVDSLIANGTTYYYPYKYKAGYTGAAPVEYLMMLRLGEQFLIRAEAEAESGDSTDAILDLNIIRARAGLSSYSVANEGPLLTAIRHENQAEMFCELGHRWLDLKRWGTATQVLSADKGITVSANSLLYPIPLTDIETDPSLVQNSGY